MAAASWNESSSGILYTNFVGTATNSAQALYSGNATTRSPTYNKEENWKFSFKPWNPRL